MESGKVKGSGLRVQGAGAGKTGERFKGKGLTRCFTAFSLSFVKVWAEYTDN